MPCAFWICKRLLTSTENLVAPQWVLMQGSPVASPYFSVPFRCSRDLAFLSCLQPTGIRVLDSHSNRLLTVTQTWTGSTRDSFVFFLFPVFLPSTMGTSAMTCSLWWHVSAHLSRLSWMASIREVFRSPRLQCRVHWKCRLSTQLSVGYTVVASLLTST